MVEPVWWLRWWYGLGTMEAVALITGVIVLAGIAMLLLSYGKDD